MTGRVEVRPMIKPPPLREPTSTVQVPTDVIKNNRLSYGARTLYCFLIASHALHDMPAISEIADAMDCSRNSIKAWLDELEAEELVSKSNQKYMVVAGVTIFRRKTRTGVVRVHNNRRHTKYSKNN